MFIETTEVRQSSWQSFERLVNRLLLIEGFDNARIVGQSGDHGADILASKNGIRWLIQVKHWKTTVGVSVIDETLKACNLYGAKVPVVVSLNGFDYSAIEYQRVLQLEKIPLQLWDIPMLIQRANRINDEYPNKSTPRPYQEDAISKIVNSYLNGTKKVMAVMATGLGKTFVAAESIRRIQKNKKIRTLVIAHTNPLVYQLEKSFWKFMSKEQTSTVWNGYEAPTISQLNKFDFVFACVNTVSEYINKNREFSNFDIIIVDECHHAGSSMYLSLIHI